MMGSDAIIRILSKFANSFDLKHWQALEETLMDNVECDYQDLRGICEVCSKSNYVDARKKALSHLKTQHLFSNLEINIEKDHATCQLSAVIYRQNNEGVQFNSHLIYFFSLIKLANNEWRISKIKQSVLWNEGDSLIHTGATYAPRN